MRQPTEFLQGQRKAIIMFRSKTGSKVMAWVMLAMVIFGLGGYGVSNFGGTVSTIGTVGDQAISTTDYGRALQRELDTFRGQFGKTLTAEQAMGMGMDGLVRQQMVTTAALDSENDRLGLSVGDANLRKSIMATQGFQGPDGKFSRDTYVFTLKQSGLTEAGYESKVRVDMARTILQQAIVGDVPAPKPYVDTILNYISQLRGFTMLKLTAADLTAPLATPDDAALKAYYDGHKADFTAPEAKIITYVSLTPDMEAAKVTIDDKTLQDLYKQRLAEFVKPETRAVQRLVYPTQAEAAAAKAKLDAGSATFEQLVADRGLTLKDIDMGSVVKDRLSAASGTAVFALTAPGVVGPVQSSLGPALFRVTSIVPAVTTTFEQAKDKLAAGLKQDKARQMISDQVETINDKLASGATLEDLAKETGMQLGTIDFTATTQDGIAAYAEFRTAAAAVKPEDFPQIIQLKDGGVAALRLDKVRPAALIPYDKVADKVLAGWKAAETAKELKARADQIVAAVKGGAPLAASGKPEVVAPLVRSGFVDGAPATLLPAVFNMKAVGDMDVLQDGQTTYVLQLGSIAASPADSADVVKARTALQDQASQGLATDSFELFASALVADTKISLDDNVIKAVNSQLH